MRYAALDLRQAFEALVYENALGYSDELVGEDCGTMIRRRLDALSTPQNNSKKTKEAITANCSACAASYTIRWEGDGYYWETQKWQAKCPFTDCDGIHEKWTREAKVGMVSKCPTCGKRSKIINSFTFLPEAVAKQIGK